MANNCDVRKPSNPTNQNIDKIDILVNNDSLNQDDRIFDIKGLPNQVSYGKHGFFISYNHENKNNYKLRHHSSVLMEVRDRNRNLIFSKVTDISDVSGAGLGLMLLREDLRQDKKSFIKLEDGIGGYITIVAELASTPNYTKIPHEWVGVYNYRETHSIEIRKNSVNISPIVFKQTPTVRLNTVTEDDSTIGNRSASVPSVIRSYTILDIDNLDTHGGKVEHVSVRCASDINDPPVFEDLITFPLKPVELLTPEISKSNSIQWAGDQSLSDETNWNVSQDGNGINFGFQSNTNFTSSIRISHNRLLGYSDEHVSRYAWLPVRKTNGEEEFTLRYNVSASNCEGSDSDANECNGTVDPTKTRVHIKYMPQSLVEGKYTSSISDAFSNIHNKDLHNAYKKEYGNFDPYDYAYSIINDVVTEGHTYDMTNFTGSQIIHDDFTIPSGSYFSIYLEVDKGADSLNIPYSYFSFISIKPKVLKGINPPTTYRKVEVFGKGRREEKLDFEVRYLNPNMEIAQDYNNYHQDVITTASLAEYNSEGFWIERGKGVGVTSGIGSEKRAISLAARFTNVTSGSRFGVVDDVYYSSSFGVIGEASTDDDFDSLKDYGPHITTSSLPSANKVNEVNGGWFNAIRNDFNTGSKQTYAYGITAQAWNSGSYDITNVYSGRFLHSDVYIDSTIHLHTQSITPAITESRLYATSDNVLYFNGSAVGSGGGGGDIDISGTPANNQLAVWTDADTLEGESELTYDGSQLIVDGDISASGDLFAGSTTGTYFSASNGDVEISGSGVASLDVRGNITASGNITSSGDIYLEDSNMLLLNSPTYGDDRIFYTSAGINIDSDQGVNAFTDFRINTSTSTGKALTVAGDISASGDLYFNTGKGIATDITVAENKKIYFDSTDTYIYADTDTAEDLIIGADGAILFEPDSGFYNTYQYYRGSMSNVAIKIGNDGVDGDIRFYAGGADVSYDLHARLASDEFVLGVPGQTDVNFIVGTTDFVVDDGLGKTAVGKVPLSADKKFTVMGDISASGDIYGQNIIAEQYIVSSSVTYVTQSYSSGSTIFGDTPADDTHQFTGSLYVSGSSVGLTVAGSISGSDLFLKSDNNPLITLERNSDQNVGIVYKNTNGHMVAGIDEDLQNDGANIFGIGYHGDIIDNDGSNHATFVVTGSQVVINNATSASSGVALTVGGDITATGNISASGDIQGENVISDGWFHRKGDGDTGLYMESNMVNLKAGGKSVIRLDNGGGQDKIELNNGNSDSDIQINSNNNGEGSKPLFYTDAVNHSVGILTNSLQTGSIAALTVEGAISASGEYYGKEGSGLIVSSSASDTTVFTVNHPLSGSLFKVDTDSGGGSLIVSGTLETHYIRSTGSATVVNVDDNLTVSGDISGSSIHATSGFTGSFYGSGNDITFSDTAMATADSLVFVDAGGGTKKDTVADVVTLLAGDGIKNSSNVFAIEPNDFAGTGLEDDGSDNLRLSTQGTGISGGNGSTLSITPAQTAITSLLATDIKIGEDDQTKIDFETNDEIHFYANNVEQVYLGDNIFGPQSDSDVDLGSTSVRWKDAYVDSVTSTGVISGTNMSGSGTGSFGEMVIDGAATARINVDGAVSASGAIYASSYDGYHGNDEFIPILPNDFGVGTSGRELGNLTDDDAGSIETANTAFNFYTTKIIPKGFTATSGVIYGNNTSATHTWLTSTVTGSGTTTIGSATAIDTTKDFTDVVGNGIEYIIAKIDPATDNDNFYGGKIFISRT